MKFLINLNKKALAYLRDHKVLHYFFVLIFMLIFLYPLSIQNTPYFMYVVGLEVVIGAIAIILTLPCYWKKDFVILVFGLFIILGISVIAVGKNLLIFVYFAIYCISMILISYFLYEVDKDNYFVALSDYSFLMIMIHGVATLFFPDGLLQTQNAAGHGIPVHFLGIGNQLSIFLLVYYVIILVVHRMNGKDGFKLPIAGVMAVIGIWYSNSATGLVGLIVFVLAITIYNLMRKYELIGDVKIKNIYRASGIILFSILLFHSLFTAFNVQKYFESFFEAAFEKDATFTDRTFIWDEAFAKIKKSPLIGYGAPGSTYIFLKSSGNKFGAHNIFLEMALMGGIPTLVAFCVMLYYTIYKLLDIKNRKVRHITFSLFIAIFTMSITEVYSLSILIFLMFLPIVINDYYKGRKDLPKVKAEGKESVN